MRHSILIFLVAIVRHIVGQGIRDPRTTKDCVHWRYIEDSREQTCLETIREWNLDPQRFHAWNPSVNLDCTPWYQGWSYCVMTNAMIADSLNGTTRIDSDSLTGYTVTLPSLTTNSDGWTIPVTRSDAPARTSTRAPIPSPRAWKEMGCFVDDKVDLDIAPQLWKWTLEFRGLPQSYNETMENCKQRCWKISYPVAGVKGGSECYCGNEINSTLAEDQSECNIPCVGDTKDICGGNNRMSIWGAEEFVQSADGVGDIASSGAGVSTQPASRTYESRATAIVTLGARRNVPVFW